LGLDPVIDGWVENRMVSWAGESGRRCQWGKFGEDVGMEVEAIVGIPFVKGNAETGWRPIGLKKTGISWMRRVISH